MMDFEPDEEQTMLAEAITRFANEQMRKVYRDADEEGMIPEEVIQAGWEFGLLQTGVPVEYGGLGEYSALTGALAMESFAYGDLSITLRIGVPNLFAVPVILAGTDSQKQDYLPRFCEVTAPKMTAALSEPFVKFDPRQLSTTAMRVEDNYILNGVKGLVPMLPESEEVLVYAAVNGRTQAFLVSRDTPGLVIGEREKLMGVRALPTYRLVLDNCSVPAANRLGGNRGIESDRLLNHGRIALAAAAVGVAKAGYEYACTYAKNRVQFGEPIAHRQAIAFMLAESAIEIDAARLLVWEAAWQIDRGNEATREVAIMRHFVDDMVLRVADRTVQTLGGYGYIREFPAELWLRNARGFASFDGLAMV